MFTFNLFTRKVGAGNDMKWSSRSTWDLRKRWFFPYKKPFWKANHRWAWKITRIQHFVSKCIRFKPWLMCSPVKQKWCQVTRWFCWHIKFNRSLQIHELIIVLSCCFSPKNNVNKSCLFCWHSGILGWVFWVIPFVKPSRHIRPARKDGHRQFWNIWINCQWGNFQGVEKHLGNTGNCHPPWN